MNPHFYATTTFVVLFLYGFFLFSPPFIPFIADSPLVSFSLCVFLVLIHSSSFILPPLSPSAHSTHAESRILLPLVYSLLFIIIHLHLFSSFRSILSFTSRNICFHHYGTIQIVEITQFHYSLMILCR